MGEVSQVFRVAQWLCVALFFARVALGRIDESAFKAADIITKDVAIIGGGASGAHAAVRLREDWKKSVVVIEKEEILGGHVDTHFDPVSGRAFEYGLQSYFEYGKVREFFARFNITLKSLERRVVPTRYVDFTTGKELTDRYIAPTTDAATAALQKYMELCEEYEHIFLPGYWNFPDGDKIPPDLLIPISEFVKKHNITDVLPRLFALTGGGIGSKSDYGKIITFYVMKDFGAHVAATILGKTISFAPITNNMDLYFKIADLLGFDILFKSMVVESERTDGGVKLVVQTPDGRKLVRAKRLLLTFQPTMINLAPFDLDEREYSILSKPTYGRAYTTIGTHSSLPNDTAIVNMAEATVPSNYTNFIQPPLITRYEHYGNGTRLYRVPVGSNNPNLTVDQALELAQKTLERLANAGIVPPLGDEKFRFLAVSDHGSVGYGVTADELRNNWIHDFYSLQGRRSTWHTGGSWATDFSTVLWEFNDDLIPRLLAGI